MRPVPYVAALTAVWAVVVVSPGPDFLVTARYATSRSRRAGLAVVAGIATGTAVWAAGALAGLELLLARASWLLEVARYGGALLLAWLGLRTIRSAGTAPAAHGGPPATPRRPWRVGVLTDLANPKAAAFWTGLFAALAPAHPPLWLQAASVATAVTVAGAWYGLVAVVFSLPGVVRAYRRARRRLDQLTGGVLLALSLRLAVRE
jgi:threonine efflux protein